MAKTRAPLLSMDAHGQIGNDVIYARTRRTGYAKTYAAPQQPNTTAQQQHHKLISNLAALWNAFPPPEQNAWKSYSRVKRSTPYASLIKINAPALRAQDNYNNLEPAPGYPGIPVITDFKAAPTGLPGQLKLTWTYPATPDGFTTFAGRADAIFDNNPHLDTLQGFTVSGVLYPNTTNIVGGLVSGQTYVIAGFIRYRDPNGVEYTGQSRTVTATPL